MTARYARRTKFTHDSLKRLTTDHSWPLGDVYLLKRYIGKPPLFLAVVAGKMATAKKVF